MLNYYRSMEDNERFVRLRDSLLYDEGSSNGLRVALMRDYIDEAVQDTLKRDSMLLTFDSLLAMPQKDSQLLMLKAALVLPIRMPDGKTSSMLKYSWSRLMLL